MVTHLKAAVDRYPEDCKNLHIHPFSKEDAEILGEIIELFKKMNFVAAVDILKRYKRVADEDIYESLLELNIKTSSSQMEQGDLDGEPLAFRYLKLEGRRLDLFLVSHYDAIEVSVGDVEKVVKNAIMFNKTPKDAKQIPFYANEIIVFDNEQDRDNALAKLDSYIELYRGKFL